MTDIEGNDTSWACDIHQEGEKFKGLGGNNRRKGTTWKTKTQLG